MRRTVIAASAALLTVALAVTTVQTADPTGSPTAAAELAGASSSASAAQVVASTPGDFTGLGFDQCVAPTQAAMDAWIKSSPYRAVGIYISGDSRACRVQPNLSPTWVTTQVSRGWRLLPIALGPQASCLARFPRYDDDFKIDPKPDGSYAAARAQGVVEADKNAADAAALGIGPGSTLWYDLEAFDLANTHCRESALAFISSWVTRTKERGYVAGFYSSASSGIKMLDEARLKRPGVFALPDRIWIARWDGVANTSTSYIAEDGWRPGNRMKQFKGGHNETWGGVTINIDTNYLDLSGPGTTTPPPPAPVPTAAPETHCGGTRIDFPTYYTLKPKAASKTRTLALQCLLKEKRRYAGRLDGDYDRATRKAAGAWMKSRDFTPTRIWRRKNWVALLAGQERPVLGVGATGPVVSRLQRALSAARQRVEVTGTFDEATRSALVAYQTRVGATATGTTDAATWAKLAKGRF
ncbi:MULTISPECIES: glycoside hydrolase domain-containing protein [Nocardioides]|uniref:glycoside hydrolase domain-containing protein n=1 Tax=Nocardioides TaxID=1839 RepID=UPI0003302992|nr:MULTISPECIES: glycoside hydrolase domain-containing protein [Nocardioides]EON22816.1 peptidoglycan binding domain-containing protein [Nocardioides sp. CF8]